jgi:signal peptidase II
MFQFNGTWPTWVPFLGGNDMFPAIWNLADGSITVGVVMVLIRQRTYFPKEKKEERLETSED